MSEDTGSLTEWLWVAGYTSVFTLLLILVFAICFSIAKNRFLQSSTHYTVIALGLRNVLYVVVCFCVLFLSKLQDDPQYSKQILQNEDVEIFCEVVSTLDTFCSALAMFYLLGLAIHMMCRNPNPSYQSRPSQSSLRMYEVDLKDVPTPEAAWQSPTLLLLPLLCAILVSLPTVLLHMPHAVAAIPGKPVCISSSNINYETITAIISTVLPLTTIIFLLLGMFVRRCLSCKGGDCISSICKEEMLLTCLCIPYSMIYFWKLMPIIDLNLTRLGMESTFDNFVADDSVTRAVEGGLGLLLPFLLYTLLPAYRMCTSYPDSSDLYQSKPDFFGGAERYSQEV